MSEKAAEPFRAPAAPIDLFNWEKDGYSRPESYARLYGVENVGLFARLWSFEDSVRCECTKRDDPVYTDSCLEIFLKPVTGDERYVNFEVNRNGVYLSQIGEKREGRRFIREITSLEPTITPFTLPGSGKSAGIHGFRYPFDGHLGACDAARALGDRLGHGFDMSVH